MSAKPETKPTFAEAFRFWLKLGFISFGGPTGQIAIMHTELVEKRRWVSEERFLHALNFCMLLPGPEATQLATYIGWLLHRTWGGVVAGALFVLPSAVILWVLSWVYVRFGSVPAVAAVFYGLKPAVVAIVAAAVLRIGSKALKTPALWSVAALAFAGLFFFKLPFPLIIFGAAAAGFLGGRWLPGQFAAAISHGRPLDTGTGLAAANQSEAHHQPSWRRAVRVTAVCLFLWWAPVALLALWLGSGHVLVREGIFFSKAALVTFGGAYAVLPYVSQQAVELHGWLSPSEMLDGLALAETTPGPLIMVLQFVGFLGGWNQPQPFPPLLAATLGAAITTWTTFVPCFLWILLGAPYIERWRRQPQLTTTLSAVTAAVVGVILNLTVWFGWHVLLPDGRHPDLWALAIALVAFVGLQWWKWNLVAVVLAAGAVGWLLNALHFIRLS